MAVWALRAGVFTGGGGLMNQLNQIGIGVVANNDFLKSRPHRETGIAGAVAMFLTFAVKNCLGYTASSVVNLPMQTFGSVCPMANPAVSIAPSWLLEPSHFCTTFWADCGQGTVAFI